MSQKVRVTLSLDMENGSMGIAGPPDRELMIRMLTYALHTVVNAQKPIIVKPGVIN